MPTPDFSPIRIRGPLELRSDHTILLHGHAIEAIGLTPDPTQLQVRTTGNSHLQPLASSDFLYVVTGLERMPEEQAQRLVTYPHAEHGGFYTLADVGCVPPERC